MTDFGYNVVLFMFKFLTRICGFPLCARAIKENLISEEPERKFYNFTEVFHEVLLALGFKSFYFKDNNDERLWRILVVSILC